MKQFLLDWLEIVYGLYATFIFIAFSVVAFVLVLLPVGIVARRHIAHQAARAVFVVIRMRLRVIGSEGLPPGPCVVVANHASYLDGIVLKAALPATFSFVIKKEITRVPLAALLLKRIGSEFVDRFNRHAGGLDARRLLKAATAGQSLVFFPEGTFIAQSGLGKFHTGAFTIAARTLLPVVPIAIRGTRRILPSGRMLPRPGAIEVDVLPALSPLVTAETTAASAQLRDEARSKLLAATGEPDLVASIK